MGIRLIGSSSSFDKKEDEEMGVGQKIPKSELREYYPSGPRLYPNEPRSNSGSGGNILSKLVKKKKQKKAQKDINPQPDNWKILKWTPINGHLVIMLEYPNCTNYEGKKILLFRSTKIEELVNQKLIDPHFSDNPDFITPIARFEPTDSGWEMAMNCAETLAK